MSITGSGWMAGEQGHAWVAKLLARNEPQERIVLSLIALKCCLVLGDVETAL